MNQHTVFTREALQAQDGKEVPLKDQPGPEGRVIGKAVLRFDEESGSLNADFEVTDPKWERFLSEDPPDTDYPQT